MCFLKISPAIRPRIGRRKEKMKLYTIKSDIAGSNGRTMRVNVVYNTEQIERNKELITGIPLQKN